MTDVPRDPEGMDDEADAVMDDEDEDEHKDQRMTKRRWEKYVEKDGELSESEDEEENQRNGVHRQPGMRKRRNMMDYQNANALSDDEDRLGGSNRARSRDSDKVNGVHPVVVTNGSGLYESSSPSPAASQGSAGLEDTTMQDADVELADETDITPAHTSQVAVEGPQEATPPDSPPTVTVNTVNNAQANADPETRTHNESATSLEPELAREDGLVEREEGDIAGEKATEIAHRIEES